jgi:hypothetical protein
MRKFALVLIVALALPAAAAARFGDKGDGTLVIKNARGQVAVTATGSALGRVDDGSIVVADTSLDSSDEIQVLNFTGRPKVDKTTGTTTYVGQKMRFRIIGGGYTLTVVGKGINVSAVGKGQFQFAGAEARDGLASADGTPFKPLLGNSTTVILFGQP